MIASGTQPTSDLLLLEGTQVGMDEKGQEDKILQVERVDSYTGVGATRVRDRLPCLIEPVTDRA